MYSICNNIGRHCNHYKYYIIYYIPFLIKCEDQDIIMIPTRTLTWPTILWDWYQQVVLGCYIVGSQITMLFSNLLFILFQSWVPTFISNTSHYNVIQPSSPGSHISRYWHRTGHVWYLPGWLSMSRSVWYLPGWLSMSRCDICQSAISEFVLCGICQGG